MNPPASPLHPRRLVRDWRAWIVGAFALYTLLGFLVVPIVGKKQIPSIMRKVVGCEASVRSLRFNPFTFNASAKGVRLNDHAGDSLATCDELFVNFAPLPAFKRVIALEEVRAGHAAMYVRIRPDRTVNAVDLVPPRSGAPPNPKPWLFRIDRIDARNSVIVVDDASFPPTAHLGIQGIDAVLTGFQAVKGDTTRFEASMQFEHGGKASASGWGMLMDGVYDGRVDADSVALVAVDGYVQRQGHVSIQSGRLNAHGNLHQTTPPGELSTGFHGDVVVEDLRTFDTLKQQDFFGFQRLSILAAELATVPPSARMDEIAVDGIYARIAVAQDGSFNVTDAFAPAIARADSIRAASAAATAPGAAPGPKPKPPDVAIGRIRIKGGEVDFSDLSLPLPFATRVHDVNGEITALAPDQMAGSQVLIEGTVDEHGFAKASGAVYAFDPRIFTALRVDFRNVELTNLTPYSGKFMGYRITRGKLTLGLNYDVKDGKLKGRNDIFLEKLTLGDKVESEEATSLPVKLAIALLKDKNGNIDLDLEVAGDLNDPKVNTWSLVWQALKKVLVKVTTAPFRFLGNLLGIGGDELEFVEFEAGRAELTPPQYERLDNLAKALAERPALSLEVHGAWNKTADANAVRNQRFQDELARRLVAGAGGDSAAAGAAMRDPSSGVMQATLEQMCTETIGVEKLAELRNASMRPAAEGAPPELNLAGYLESMRDALIAKVPVSEEELVQIADRRTAAIRGYLVEMKTVPAERVKILETDVSDDRHEEWVRCKLGLGALE